MSLPRTPRTVLLTQGRWKLIDDLRAKHGLKSLSEAVDLLIMEWWFFCQGVDGE